VGQHQPVQFVQLVPANYMPVQMQQMGVAPASYQPLIMQYGPAQSNKQLF
jgi:hypothetical protein